MNFRKPSGNLYKILAESRILPSKRSKTALCYLTEGQYEDLNTIDLYKNR